MTTRRARLLFAAGVTMLVLFELANVYFIMPMPYSQRMRSIDLAYALHRWRGAIRGVAAALMVVAAAGVWRTGGWSQFALVFLLAVTGGIAYVANFQMAADHMFRQPRTLRMVPTASNEVALDRLVVGIEINGDARAYPIQYIGYHHQVRDTVGGEDVLVSYCTVCRTARVFSPKIDGVAETFRLVGMDHYHAMLEDRRTGSWWRQANGEAVVGALKGRSLTEFPSVQVTLAEWLHQHAESRVMQADSAFFRAAGHRRHWFARRRVRSSGTAGAPFSRTASAIESRLAALQPVARRPHELAHGFVHGLALIHARVRHTGSLRVLRSAQ